MSSTFKRRVQLPFSSSKNGVKPLSTIAGSGVNDSVVENTSSDIDTSTNSRTTTTTTTTAIGPLITNHHGNKKIWGTTGNSNSNNQLQGTKPWTGNIILTSTGLKELDTIISSAGQPLGTCIYIEEDRLTNHLSQSIVQYWCAEALCQDQELIFPIMECEELPTTIMNDTQQQQQSFLFQSSTNQSSNCFSTNTTSLESSTLLLSSSSSRDDIHELIYSLPRDLHRDKREKKELDKNNATKTKTHNESFLTSNNQQLLDVVEEDENSNDDDNDDDDKDDNETVPSGEEKLEIAWQYSKNIQLQRSGLIIPNSSSVSQRSSTIGVATSVYCHSYDLAGRLVDQIDALSLVRFISINQQPVHPTTDKQTGFNMFTSIAKQLEKLLSEKPNTVIRIMFNRPTNIKSFGVMLPLLMSFIRKRKLPIVVLVRVQPWTLDDNTACLTVQRCCDVVLIVEGFASRRDFPPPAEFRMLHGLLHIRKVSTCTSSLGHFADLTITKRPAAYLYGLRRDRRKLNIQLLHIPPEDYAAGGGSVGGGGVRSSAGKTSTSSISDATSILDF